MSKAYDVLMVEVGNMSKRQTTAVFDYADEIRAERDAFSKLLKEAVKIVHANSRNINKDWLSRARAALTPSTLQNEVQRG